jgi:predicted nucleic acid-binding protein
VAFVIAYIDTSVVLRIVFQEPHQLEEWLSIRTPIASELIVVEVRRSLDRVWLRKALTEDDFARKAAEAEAILAAIIHTELDRHVLDRAAERFPTPLGTLDAVHLATALRLRDSKSADERPAFFATHDLSLARAARAVGFEVLGAPA